MILKTISEIDDSFAFLDEYSHHDADESQHINQDDTNGNTHTKQVLMKEIKFHSKSFPEKSHLQEMIKDSEDILQRKLRTRS